MNPKNLLKFPGKGWRVRSVNKLPNRFREYGTTDRQPGSGRPKTARTAENIEAVDDLILSQDSASQTHRTTRQISRETKIHRSSVSRIVHKDLGLKNDVRKNWVLQIGLCVLFYHVSCCEDFQLPQRTSYASPTKKSSRSRHQSTYRMATYEHWLVQRNARFPLNSFCARDWPSASPSWSLWLSTSWAVRVSCSSSEVSKWTGSITGTYSFLKNFCQPSVI